MANLNIDIAYYNDEQRTLFQSFPNANALNQIVQNVITVTKDEFLAYMMFMDQDDTYAGYRTYDELRNLISSRLGDIQNYLSYNNNSVQSIVTPERMFNARFTERIGISLGLCLINKIYGFTAADWKKIPETTLNSTFDFEIPVASTGTNFIQVENKGCIVDDNSYKRPTVSSRYGEIKVKKDYVRDEEIKKQIPIHQNLYYGTIGVLDNRPNSNAKIWLVDPPAFEIEMEPRKYKLLARLRYYLDEFKNIGVKKRITEALEKRIKEIEISDDFMQLNLKKIDDGYPLRGGYYLYMESSSFVSIDFNEAFGKIFLIEDKQRVAAYLIAYPKTILRLIVKQDFEAILNYTYNSDFMNEDVQVLMKYNKTDFSENKLPNNLKFILNERNRIFEAIYFGKVNYTSDGRIFGLLDNNQKQE